MDDGAHTGGVQQHYMHGLCFDGMWDYHTRSRKGRKSWARLDLGSDAYPWAQEDDSEGAGWCVMLPPYSSPRPSRNKPPGPSMAPGVLVRPAAS